jgi:hypothetical protein
MRRLLRDEWPIVGRMAGALVVWRLLLLVEWSRSDSTLTQALIEALTGIAALAVTHLGAALINARPTFRLDWLSARGMMFEAPVIPLELSDGEASRFFRLRLEYIVVGWIGRRVARWAGLTTEDKVYLRLRPSQAVWVGLEEDQTSTVSCDGSDLTFSLSDVSRSGTVAWPTVEMIPRHAGTPIDIGVSLELERPVRSPRGRSWAVRLLMRVETIRVN